MVMVASIPIHWLSMPGQKSDCPKSGCDATNDNRISTRTGFERPNDITGSLFKHVLSPQFYKLYFVLWDKLSSSFLNTFEGQTS